MSTELKNAYQKIKELEAENARLKNDRKLFTEIHETVKSIGGKTRELLENNGQLLLENAELRARLDKAVELPCKVGDVVYRICPKCNDKHDGSCNNCAWASCITNCGCDVFGLWDDGQYPVHNCIIVPYRVSWRWMPSLLKHFGSKIFLTRAQAEARLKELEYIDNEKAYSARWWSTKKELPVGEVLECRKKQEALIAKMSITDLEELIHLTNNKQAKIYYAEQIDIKKGGGNPDLK